MAKGRNLTSYIKSAFFARWNLLAVIGAGVAAFLSPWPDALLPLLAAVELTYLAAMVSHPRFRNAIDAKDHASKKSKTQGKRRAAPISLQKLIRSLPTDSRRRFVKLRSHCLEMSHIAVGVQGQTSGSSRADELRTPALDRLLWVFLRLLVSQHALKRFISNTDETELTGKLAGVRAKFEAIDDATDPRIKTSLQDSIAVAELRLSNYQKAQGNAEFIDLELDRIEAKIQALVELSVNRRDPDYLTDQVDAAAESMKQTESAISELQNITGLTDVLEEPPPILESDLRGTIASEA